MKLRTIILGTVALMAAGSAGLVLGAPHFGPAWQTGLGAGLAVTTARMGPDSGVAVTVLGGAAPFAWSGASGTGAGSNRLIRTGSVTKTFVAATLLRLVEGSRIGLDDPVSRWLPADVDAMLRQDGYDTGAITVRMLADHTSGIADFFSMPGWIDGLLAEPERVWTRDEQIRLATAELAPLGRPGERFFYSDTGYVLLGLVIEQAAGEPLPAAVRRLLRFDDLGLSDTAFENLEPAPQATRARQRLMGVDGWTIDASADLWGAGGIVTTTDDLARFFLALAEGRVFEKPGTLTLMTTPSPQSLAAGDDGYGLGVSLARLKGETCFGHSGFWGVLALACTNSGVAVAGMVTDGADQAALKDMVGGAAWLGLR